MKYALAVVTVGVLVGLAQSGGDDARAIIARGIKAAGGEANLEKHKSATWREKGTYYGMGDGLPYTGKLAIQWPDQFRMEIEGVFIMVLNKDKGWTQAGGDTKAMSKEEVDRQQSAHKAAWMSTLLPLKDKAFTLAVIDGVEVNKKPTVGVKVTRKDHPEVKLYFDKKSGLLVKGDFRAFSDEQKKEVLQEMYYENHKEVDGAQVPTRIVIKRDGKLFVDTEVMDLKTGKVDAKLFAAP